MAGLDLTDRKVLVTGGARGLGAGMAEALAAAGATARFVQLDVTSDEDWASAVAHTIAELGGLDVVINNAGIEITQLIADADPADLLAMLNVNIVGTTLGIKHAFRAMRPDGAAGKGGVVINVASVAAAIAFPGISGYSATKSAVERLTKVAAMESGKLGYGVRVNAILPGLVPTEMGMKLAVETSALGLFESPDAAVGAVIGLTPSGRLGEVSDMADAGSATGRSTCWACRGAGRSPSSSRCRTPAGAVAWSSRRRRPECSWCHRNRRCCGRS